MPRVLLPSRYQPSPGRDVEANPSNPISDGLLIAFVGSQTLDPVNGLSWTDIGSTANLPNEMVVQSNKWPGHGIVGQYSDYNRILGLHGSNKIRARDLEDISGFCLWSDVTLTGAGYAIGHRDGSDQDVGWFFNPGPVMNLNRGGGTNMVGPTLTASVDLSDIQSVGFSSNKTSYGGHTGRQFYNGQFGTSVAGAIGTNPNTFDAPWHILSRWNNYPSIGWPGTGLFIPLAILWQRNLSDDEHTEIHNDPWQLFRPIVRRSYFFAASGGTGDVSVNASGSQIVSASGTPVVARDKAIAGSSSSAFVGTLGKARDKPLAGYSVTSASGVVWAARAVVVSGTQAATAIGALTPSILNSRYSSPLSDVSAGAWAPSAGGDLYAMLDESSADDGDYIHAESASICELALQPVADPGTSSGQALSYRARSANGNTLIATLKQGATVIATRTHNNVPTSWTDLEMNLSGAECDAITNYSALSVTFEPAT